MTTKYYLNDPRILYPEEIEWVKIRDQRTLVCEKAFRGTRDGKPSFMVLLYVGLVELCQLPPDTRLTNDNNDMRIETVGDLLELLRRPGTVVLTYSEIHAREAQGYLRWRMSKQGLPGWEAVTPQINLDDLNSMFLSSIGAQPLIERYLGLPCSGYYELLSYN